MKGMRDMVDWTKRRPDPAYKGVRYFEMYPLCNGGEPVRISLNDSISVINKNLKGVVRKNVDLDYTSHYKGIQGIKTDIQTKLSAVDKLRLKQALNWNCFKEYRYCMVQLDGHKSIDLFAIKNFNAENKSKVVTDSGEITLYDLCVNLKLFGFETPIPHPNNLIISSELLENITVMIFDNVLCFNKYDLGESRESGEERFRKLNIMNIKSIMNVYNETEIGGKS